MTWAVLNGVRHVVAASSAAVYGNPGAAAMPIKVHEPHSLVR